MNWKQVLWLWGFHHNLLRQLKKLRRHICKTNSILRQAGSKQTKTPYCIRRFLTLNPWGEGETGLVSVAIRNRRTPHIAALVLASDLFLLVSFRKPSCVLPCEHLSWFSYLNNDLFIFILWVWMFACRHVPNLCWGQKEVSELLQLKLKMVVSCRVVAGS